VTKKKKFYNIDTWSRIHNTPFSSKLTNGPKKLERCILASLTSLVNVTL